MEEEEEKKRKGSSKTKNNKKTITSLRSCEMLGGASLQFAIDIS